MRKTCDVILESVRSEEWNELARALKLDEETSKKYFEAVSGCLCATVELTINDKLEIVSGRIVPVDE